MVLVLALFPGIVAYGAAYVVRGLLGGVRWFEGYGIGLVADSVVRLLVAVPLLVVASSDLAAAAIVAAGVAGAPVPLAWDVGGFDGSAAAGLRAHDSGSGAPRRSQRLPA